VNSFGWTNISDCCVWYGVKCDADEKRVISLNLSNNGLSGVLMPSISNLKRLKTLILSHNKLRGVIPEFLTTLTGDYRCDKSDLQNSPSSDIYQPCDPFKDTSNRHIDCNGGICSFIGGLSHLRLNDNMFRGSLPDSISRLYKTLQVLDLNTNQLDGAIPRSIGALSQLVELDFYSNTFSSSIPPELGLLGNLRYLNLAFNLLSGAVPNSLANLIRLEYLDLSVNGFSGGLPLLLGVLVEPPTPPCDRPGGTCFGSTLRNLTLNGRGECDTTQLVLRYVMGVKMPCNDGVQDQSYSCASCAAPYSASKPSVAEDCYNGLPPTIPSPDFYQRYVYPPYAPTIEAVPTPTIGPKLRISVITRCTYSPSLYAVEPS
jgi:Leucine-rich repeat (LRR) protein